MVVINTYFIIISVFFVFFVLFNGFTRHDSAFKENCGTERTGGFQLSKPNPYHLLVSATPLCPYVPDRLGTECAFYDCSKKTECALCAQSVNGIMLCKQISTARLRCHP